MDNDKMDKTLSKKKDARRKKRVDTESDEIAEDMIRNLLLQLKQMNGLVNEIKRIPMTYLIAGVPSVTIVISFILQFFFNQQYVNGMIIEYFAISILILIIIYHTSSLVGSHLATIEHLDKEIQGLFRNYIRKRKSSLLIGISV